MDFKDITHVSKGALEMGRLRIQGDGVIFKSSSTDKVSQVKHSEIDTLEWMRAARGFGVKVMSREGHMFKYDGFKESDYGRLKEMFKQQFGKELQEVELCVKGWNWGEPVFKGSVLTFLVDSKPAFEVPLDQVSQVTSGKNEVTLGFHQSESAPVSLVEMRFHIPNTATDGDEDPVQTFHDRVLSKADVMQATGDAIAAFAEMQCLTPRGRYTIKVYPTFVWAHGKTYDYKIPLDTINRLFLLPHNDQRQMFFVLGLDPPIRQGLTRYPFVILLLPNDETCEISLTITEEEISEKYGGKLSQFMEGPLYEVFSKIMRVIVGRKITVPGKFKSKNNHAIACSCRTTSGFLYPLDKGFIFVHKPAIYIRFEEISAVNFARLSDTGMSRSFDFDIDLKDGTSYHFGSLVREDYGKLSEYVAEKKIRVKNKSKNNYSADMSGGSSDEHDVYMERMKAEGEERSSDSEDEDYNVGEEGHSADEFEYDSDAQLSGSDGGEEEEREKPTRKRKKEQQSKSRPAKKQKDDGSGKKKRPVKDPNAPKKALSPYFLWLQEYRPVLKKSHPSASVSEIAKLAGEVWNKMSDGEKVKWKEAAEKDKLRYQREMSEYTPGSAPTQSSKKSEKSSTSVRPKSSGSFKSAEFIEDDSSGNEEEEDAEEVKNRTTSQRGRGKVKEEELVALPEEGSESEAEMTSGESSGSDD